MTLQELIGEAFSWRIVRRSLIISGIVGAILIAINHGSCFLNGEFRATCVVQSVLTILVPYCVSTVSCVLAYKINSLSKVQFRSNVRTNSARANFTQFDSHQRIWPASYGNVS